jgi:hypothetical protein
MQIRGKPDQKNVCLVSRACCDLQAPMLWNTLEADFQTHNETRFDALVNPKSHIIANITHLKLKAIPGENAITANQRGALLVFLAALPSNKLRGFESSVGVDRMTFLSILQLQQRLEEPSILG